MSLPLVPWRGASSGRGGAHGRLAGERLSSALATPLARLGNPVFDSELRPDSRSAVRCRREPSWISRASRGSPESSCLIPKSLSEAHGAWIHIRDSRSNACGSSVRELVMDSSVKSRAVRLWEDRCPPSRDSDKFADGRDVRVECNKAQNAGPPHSDNRYGTSRCDCAWLHQSVNMSE